MMCYANKCVNNQAKMHQNFLLITYAKRRKLISKVKLFFVRLALYCRSITKLTVAFYRFLKFQVNFELKEIKAGEYNRSLMEAQTKTIKFSNFDPLYLKTYLEFSKAVKTNW